MNANVIFSVLFVLVYPVILVLSLSKKVDYISILYKRTADNNNFFIIIHFKEFLQI